MNPEALELAKRFPCSSPGCWHIPKPPTRFGWSAATVGYSVLTDSQLVQARTAVAFETDPNKMSVEG
jgi:hypothetical protein